jgi:hypothetical protein
MTQEGDDADQECSAHEKRRRQHRQVLEHRPGSLPSRAIFAPVQTPATCRKPASSRALASLGHRGPRQPPVSRLGPH